MSEEFKLGKLFKSVKMTVIIHLSSYWRNSDLSARILQHHKSTSDSASAEFDKCLSSKQLQI